MSLLQLNISVTKHKTRRNSVKKFCYNTAGQWTESQITFLSLPLSLSTANFFEFVRKNPARCSVRLVLGCRIQDPQVSGWLLDPADPATCYQDLIKKHLRPSPPQPAPGTSKVRSAASPEGGGIVWAVLLLLWDGKAFFWMTSGGGICHYALLCSDSLTKLDSNEKNKTNC